MAKIPHRLYLTEDQMPKQWYNLRADMKEKPDPLIHPGTHQPLPEEALSLLPPPQPANMVTPERQCITLRSIFCFS